MSCGLPLEFFEDESARVQLLADAPADQGTLCYQGGSEDAGPWLAWITQGNLAVAIVRPVAERGAYVYWVQVMTGDASSLPQRHYLITWRVWFELRRLRLV